MKKILVIGVIFLFLGVAVAPSINFNVVKASDDNDFVEVTTQACGIKGYGNTTVKLTKEQYQNLEQYLVGFRARLNQTTTREEAVPIFKEAVVELNTYGLLPKGMSVEKARRLVTGWNDAACESLLKNRQRADPPSDENLFCLLFLAATKNLSYSPDYFFVVMGPLYFLRVFVLFICPSPYSFLYKLFPNLIDLIFKTLSSLNDKSPLRLFTMIFVSGDGTCFSIGLNGLVRSNTHDYLILGFTGITLRTSDDKVYLFGFTPVLN